MTPEEKSEAWIPNGLTHLNWQIAKADETYYDGQVLLVWEKLRNIQNGHEWCEIFTVHIEVCDDGEASAVDQSGNWGGDLREGLIYVDVSDPSPEFAQPNTGDETMQSELCESMKSMLDIYYNPDTFDQIKAMAKNTLLEALDTAQPNVEEALAALNKEKPHADKIVEGLEDFADDPESDKRVPFKKVEVRRIRRKSDFPMSVCRDFEAHFETCARCGKSFGIKKEDIIESYTSVTMPSYMWDEIRKEGYCVIE